MYPHKHSLIFLFYLSFFLHLYLSCTEPTEPNDEAFLIDKNIQTIGSNVLDSLFKMYVLVQGTEPISFQWYKDNNKIDGANGDTLRFDSLNAADDGIYQCEIWNISGNDSTNRYALQVQAPPIITTPDKKIITDPLYPELGTPYVLNISAIGSSALVYSWFHNGVTTGGNNDTLIISSFSTNDTGAYQCIVSNNYGSDTSKPLMAYTNLPPLVDAGNDTTVKINGTIRLNGTVSDDGTIAKYEWKFGNNPWIETSSPDTAITVPSTAQTYICSLKVTDDGGETGVDYVTISVVLNPPPVVDAGNDTTVNVNGTIYLNGTASDDGTIVKYEWKFGANPWIQTSSCDTNIIAPSTEQTYICSLRVTDDGGAFGVDFVTVTVNQNNPPVVDAGKDTAVKINGTIYLDGTASDDGTIVKYEWRFGNSPWVQTSSCDTAIIAPATEQIYICSLKVTDDEGAYGVDYVTIIVAINPPPVVDAGNDTTVKINGTIYLNGTASDDGTIIKYEWRFGANPWIETSSPDTVITAPSTAQTYICSLKVTDDGGAIGVDYVTIIVTLIVVDNIPPVITINPPNPVNLGQGFPYIERGATAWDNVDGDITHKIDTINDSVNTDVIGTYRVHYVVSDSAGNKTDTIRIVNVLEQPDTIPPVITLLGDNPMALDSGDTYNEPGATAIDDKDGDITDSIIINADSVNTSVVGVYRVHYTVADRANNTAHEIRTVNAGIAPQDSIIIGMGSTTGQHLPMDCYYGYTYSQSIYIKNELNVSGPITIDSICYYYNGSSSFSDAIRVYMGNTSKISYTDTTDWVSAGSMTQVFNGSYSVGPSAGWYTIILSTPFTYNNSNNLVIAFDENTAGYHIDSDEFHCSSKSATRSIWFYGDMTNPNPSSPPTSGNGTSEFIGGNSYCPNIIIYYH